MKIKIIAVGKLKSDLKKILDKYFKKIKMFSNIELIEIKEKNHKNIKIQKIEETKLILENIKKSEKVILLSLNGKKMNSVEFSKKLKEPKITFVIGGSNGVDEENFNNKICFSDLTFPHQLFRIFLAEQIYRGLSIEKGMKYNK